jgi:hypothetical protein
LQDKRNGAIVASIVGAKFGRLVSHHLHLHHCGYGNCSLFGNFGIFSNEQFVDGFYEQFDPMFEVICLHSHEGVDVLMHFNWVARIHGFVEDSSLPKVIHFGQVSDPINLDNLIEEMANLVIGLYFVIERIDHQDDLGARLKFGFHGRRNLRKKAPLSV